MTCPGCCREHPSGARFCAHCGSLLSKDHAHGTEAPYAEVRRGPAETASFANRPWNEPHRGDFLDINSLLERGWTLIRSLKDRTETTEDLAHGQVVIIAARWILVVAGLTLALWNPSGMGDLQVSIVFILGLAMANFFLHAHVLMGRPVSTSLAYAASAADVAVISLVVIVAGGFDTIPFVFYFPALLALSVAFPTRVTAAFAAATIATYGLISVATASPSEGANVIAQMVMLAGVAVCGNVYWRIERDRRGLALGSRGTTEAQVRDEVPTT